MERIKADVDLFAIYQTMYSHADIEMWYDWNRRLKDTKWTDNCYFFLMNGTKIGGAVITDEKIMFPFMDLPFCDRLLFWSMLLKLSPRPKINGVLDTDCSVLPMFGYKCTRACQVMCWPADVMEAALPDGFFARPFDLDREAGQIGRTIVDGYRGGFCYEKYGEQTHDEAIADLKRVIGVYAPKNLSFAVVEANTQQIVGVCFAGIGENYTLGYVEIADIGVLPAFRGRGIAKYMISQIIAQAHGLSPFVKLLVDIGNDAEYVYRQMGFIAGPRVSNMKRCSA